jgi:transcriptional regulator with XRE-family HTH domain
MTTEKRKRIVDIAKQIKALRISKGLTQTEAATVIFMWSGKACSQTLVSQTELGNKYISDAQRDRFINALEAYLI